MSAYAAVEAFASVVAPTAPRACAAAAVVIVVTIASMAVAAAAHLLLADVPTTTRLPLLLSEEQLPGVAPMDSLLFFGVGVFRNLKPADELLDRTCC